MPGSGSRWRFDIRPDKLAVLLERIRKDFSMSERKWRPIPARDRRVVGVLAEKAKTTPDVYPMTINAIISGCNQKSNRYPMMELDESDVEEALDRLKQVGVVIEVQTSSRVARFKHLLYDWLGVDKVELAVMTELLLRGAQTEGELRGRAARMEPINDLAALRPVLDSLRQKGLIVSLTPEGRGHVLTHALYEERELEKLHAEHGRLSGESDGNEGESRVPVPRVAATTISSDAVATLRAELRELRRELEELRGQFDELAASMR
jgi:uncharacterized protein YceH (UPF0502 family)